MEIDVEQIKEALAPIAEKIGEGAAFTYETILRQVYVSAAGFLIAVIITAVIGVVGVKLLLRAAEKEKGKHYSDEGLFRGLAAGLGFLSLGLSGAFLYETVSRLINPHYFAIRWVLQAVTG